jgi:hypothetical protein
MLFDVHRGAVLALVALAGAACSSETLPGELGDACSVTADCVAGLGLTCDQDRCLGDTIVPGQVFFPQQEQFEVELHVVLFRDGDVGADNPLIPSRAQLARIFTAPVNYPASFQLSGVPPGEFEVVAYVIVAEGLARRGQVDVAVDTDGELLVNGLPSESASITITGESSVED